MGKTRYLAQYFLFSSLISNQLLLLLLHQVVIIDQEHQQIQNPMQTTFEIVFPAVIPELTSLFATWPGEQSFMNQLYQLMYLMRIISSKIM